MMKNFVLLLAILISTTARANGPSVNETIDFFRTNYNYGWTFQSVYDHRYADNSFAVESPMYITGSDILVDEPSSWFGSNEQKHPDDLNQIKQTQNDIVGLLSSQNVDESNKKRLFDLLWWGMSRKLVFSMHQNANSPFFSEKDLRSVVQFKAGIFDEDIQDIFNSLTQIQSNYSHYLEGAINDSDNVKIASDNMPITGADFEQNALATTGLIHELYRMRSFLNADQTKKLEIFLYTLRHERFHVVGWPDRGGESNESLLKENVGEHIPPAECFELTPPTYCVYPQ